MYHIQNHTNTNKEKGYLLNINTNKHKESGLSRSKPQELCYKSCLAGLVLHVVCSTPDMSYTTDHFKQVYANVSNLQSGYKISRYQK